MLRTVVTMQALDESEDAAVAQVTVHGSQVPDRERGVGRLIGRVADRQLQLVAFPWSDGLAVGAAQDAPFRGDGSGACGILATFSSFFFADFLDFAGAELAFAEFFFGFFAGAFFKFAFAFFFDREFFFEGEWRRAGGRLSRMGGAGEKQAGEHEEDYENRKPE